MYKSTLLLAMLFLVFSSANAQRKLIHCGSLINGKTSEIRNQVTIIVEGNKIVSVENGFTTPAGNDQVIDLKKKTVMPGLIDMHVHLESETSKDQQVKKFTQNEADIAFQSTIYAKKTLMAGFTTVRDCGGTGVNTALRNAINQGNVVGPRVLSAGKGVATTGGHGDPTN
jgi:imidazolonepropionase-like amidohydrolase